MLYNILSYNFAGDGWLEKFYFIVDSTPSPLGNRIRSIEQKVFRSQRRMIVKESKKKDWKGTPEQNNIADIKVR